MNFKNESGAVLVVESAMTIQLVMLVVLLFALSAMLILQKNQLYYHANEAIVTHAKMFDKGMTIQQALDTTKNPESYHLLYAQPKPYRYLFHKVDNTQVIAQTQVNMKDNQVGKMLGYDVKLAQHTKNLIQKKVVLSTSYQIDVMEHVLPNTFLQGEFSVSAPILLSYDFIRQVDLADDVITQKLPALKKVVSAKGLLQRTNMFLKQLMVR